MNITEEGCCAIANLGAANSFLDTANSSTVKRSDKNAKRSGKMRCSLPHSSFFSVRYIGYAVKECYKFEDVGSRVCKSFFDPAAQKIEILSDCWMPAGVAGI